MDWGPIEGAHGMIVIVIKWAAEGDLGMVRITPRKATYDEEGPVPESQKVVQFGREQSIDNTIRRQKLHLVKHFLLRLAVGIQMLTHPGLVRTLITPPQFLLVTLSTVVVRVGVFSAELGELEILCEHTVCVQEEHNAPSYHHDDYKNKEGRV